MRRCRKSRPPDTPSSALGRIHCLPALRAMRGVRVILPDGLTKIPGIASRTRGRSAGWRVDQGRGCVGHRGRRVGDRGWHMHDGGRAVLTSRCANDRAGDPEKDQRRNPACVAVPRGSMPVEMPSAGIGKRIATHGPYQQQGSEGWCDLGHGSNVHGKPLNGQSDPALTVECKVCEPTETAQEPRTLIASRPGVGPCCRGGAQSAA